MSRRGEGIVGIVGQEIKNLSTYVCRWTDVGNYASRPMYIGESPLFKQKSLKEKLKSNI